MENAPNLVTRGIYLVVAKLSDLDYAVESEAPRLFGHNKLKIVQRGNPLQMGQSRPGGCPERPHFPGRPRWSDRSHHVKRAGSCHGPASILTTCGSEDERNMTLIPLSLIVTNSINTALIGIVAGLQTDHFNRG